MNDEPEQIVRTDVGEMIRVAAILKIMIFLGAGLAAIPTACCLFALIAMAVSGGP